MLFTFCFRKKNVFSSLGRKIIFHFHFKTGRDPFFWSDSMDEFTFLEAGDFGQGKINYEVNAFFQIVWLFIIQRETIRIHNTLRTKRMPQRGCEGRTNFQSSHSWRIE